MGHPLNFQPNLAPRTGYSSRRRAQLRRLGTAHQPRTLDIAVGISLAHAHQDLPVLEHLESPAAHGHPPGTKSPQSTRAASNRDARPLPQTGSNMLIIGWLHYADPALAPICRSSAGSFMPITKWLQYAGR